MGITHQGKHYKVNEKMLESIKSYKSLYYTTGMILLQDLNQNQFFYYRKKAILIPLEQKYLGRTYGDTDVLPSNKISIGGKQIQGSFLHESDICEIFDALRKTDIYKEWDIAKRSWKVSYLSNYVYDGYLRKVRIKRPDERVSLSQSVYLFKGCLAKGDSWDLDFEMWSKYELYPVSDERQDTGYADHLGSSKDDGKCMHADKQDTSYADHLGSSKDDGKCMHADKQDTDYADILASSKDDGKCIHADKNESLQDDIKSLLNCDKRRCRLDSYEESMLYDIKRGHWDLFESKSGKIPDTNEAKKLIARDPRKDIRNGIVGIDFGTKSTVVVRQNDTNAIIPIRIGTGGLSRKIKEKDYENPTVIECTDLDEFLKKYYEKPGRPETSCEDFFISYDAFQDFTNCQPDEFYAYYAQLKQWANHEKEDVSVLDKRGKEYQFDQDNSQEERRINPIELYAYYIGLYINNMRNGIYLKYLLSFPVGYSIETRQLIAHSFEKGIRKSLPSAILWDKDCMRGFSVKLGISEPAAYAVTALEMSGLDPKDETESYMYGIFDFGGGTTDFDFGIWRGASEEEYEIEGYDYVLECFGADSDVTLGGENILELLAYHVFQKNKELARSKKITFSLPAGQQEFPGSEILISNSQIANRNMSVLKEALRPLWHQENGWDEADSEYGYRHELHNENQHKNSKNYEEYLNVTLYDIEGKPQPNCRLVLDTDELVALIKERIQKGVEIFFRCMERTFKNETIAQKQKEKVYIFLAGNASKSVFVKELFENTIQDYYRKFKEMDEHAGTSYFELMEPLYTEQTEESIFKPNAKTGVAYGLIKSRDGSSIKIVKNYETDAQQEARFKYYLGRERRHCFDCRLSPAEVSYGEWIRFQGAVKQTVRIYFTTNPVADSGRISIEHMEYREISIEPENGKFIFIRTCEPSVIQYASAVSQEDIDEKRDIRILDFDE